METSCSTDKRRGIKGIKSLPACYKGQALSSTQIRDKRLGCTELKLNASATINSACNTRRAARRAVVLTKYYSGYVGF